jgi:MFS family permease
VLTAGAVSITPAFFGGKLSDRFSRRYIAIAGITLTFISYLLLVRIGAEIPVVFILVSLVLGGLGAALFQPSMANLTIGTLSCEQYGFGSGAIETMRLMDNTLPMGLVTLVFGIFLVPKIVTSANSSEFLSAERTLFPFIRVMHRCTCNRDINPSEVIYWNSNRSAISWKTVTEIRVMSVKHSGIPFSGKSLHQVKIY